MSKKLKKSTSLLLAVIMILAMIPMMSISVGAYSGDYDTLSQGTTTGDDSDSMALFMDKPLYIAIADKYFSGNDFTVAQAKAFSGNFSIPAQTPKLTGTARGLEYFTGLTQLIIVDNALSGAFPDISGLTKLKDFRVYNNLFTGAFPKVSGLTDLERLQINDNYFTGNIPDLSALTKLNYLAANRNFLSGEIPDFSLNPLLTDIRLDLNSLSGVANLNNPALKVFLLSENRLTGVTGIGNSPLLTQFAVASNLFTSIPDLSSNTALTNINFLDNRLNCELPAYIGQFKDLNWLGLSGNPNLRGQLPSFNVEGGAKINVLLEATGLTGDLSEAFASRAVAVMRVIHSFGLTAKPVSVDTFTSPEPSVPINLESSIYKYSDGSPMILNQDIDGDGIADLNLTFPTNGGAVAGSEPTRNIDVNGDRKADLLIIRKGISLTDAKSYNQATTVLETNADGTNVSPRVHLGYRPHDTIIAEHPITASDVVISDTAPYYLTSSKIILNVKTVISPVTGEEIEVTTNTLNSLNNPLELNKLDEHGNMVNIDLNGDGIPDLCVVDSYNPTIVGTDEHGYPVFETINKSDNEPANPIQSDDPNGANYTPTGKVEDLYNITLIEGEEPTINVLPPNTKPTEFDNGKYVGEGEIENEVKIAVDPEGNVVMPEADAVLTHLQFDFKHNATPIAPASGFGLFSLVSGGVDTKDLERGEEYSMEVYLEDMRDFSSFTLPLEFDTSVIEIARIDKGVAWGNTLDYDLKTIYSNATSPETGKGVRVYEALNSLVDYEEINTLGAFVLTFESMVGKALDIDVMTTPVSPQENHFFTVIFRVKEDAGYNKTTGFAPTGKLQTLGGTWDLLSLIDGVGTQAIVSNTSSDPNDGGTTHYTVSFGPTATQPKVMQREINIIAPVTNEQNYTMAVNEMTVDLDCDIVGTAFADLIAVQGVKWTVTDPTGALRSAGLLQGDTTKTPTFTPDMSGVYTIYLDAADPAYKGKGYGTWITITVTSGATVYGHAMLSGKYRLPATLYGYTTRGAALDEDIKVELVEGVYSVGTGKVIGDPVYTSATVSQINGKDYNFVLPLDEKIVDEINNGSKSYYIRFTRIGASENGTNPRKESYLCAEILIDTTSAISRNASISFAEPIYLTAGAFETPSALKLSIDDVDVNAIKALIGRETTGADAQSEVYNINEYANIDAGDLSNVRRFHNITKKVGTVKFNSTNSIVTIVPSP